MASQDDAITYFIDREGVKSDKEFIVSALNEVYQGYQKIQSIKIDLGGLSNGAAINTTLKQATTQSDALARSSQTVTDRMAKLNGQSKEFTQNLLLQTKAEKEAANADLIRAKTTNENIKAQAAKQKQSVQSEKALKAEQKAAEDATNDYKQLSLAYNEAALRAKNLVLRLGEQHPVAKEAVSDAKALHDQLLRLDQSVGQSQRNVGNYNGVLGVLSKTLKGFGGLGRILGEAVGIDPNITKGIIEAGRALKDVQHAKEIENLTERESTEAQIAHSAATQKATIFQRVYNAVVGESTGAMKVFKLALAGLGIGLVITAVVALIRNWKDLNGEHRALESGLKNLKNVTEDTKDKLRSYGSTIKEVSEGAIKGLEENVKKLNDELGHTPNLLEESSAAIQLNSTEIDRLTKSLQEFQTIGNRPFRESLGNVIPFLGGGTVDKLKEAQKNLEELTKLTVRLKVLQAEQSIKAHEDADLEDIKREAQLRIDANNRVLNDERTTEQERLVLLRDNAEKRKVIIHETLLQELNAAEGNSLQEREARLKANADLVKNERDLQEQQQKVRDEFAQRHIQAEFTIKELELQNEIRLSKEIFENEKASFSDRFQALQTFLTRTKRLNDLAAAAQKSKLGLTAEEKDVIDAQAAFKTGEALDFVNKKLADIIEKQKEQYLVHTPNMAKAWEDAADRINKKIKEQTDLFLSEEKRKQEEQRKTQADYENGLKDKRRLEKELADELTNFTFSIFTNQLERDKNALQDQINLIEERKAKDIEAANQTITNEQDKAAAIAVITARAQAQTEALQRKQKEDDEKKARFEKAQSVVHIIESTAAREVEALSYLSNPATAPLYPSIAALIAAIGAAQLATVIAQPIPHYRTGKNKDDYEGPAIVGDGGRKEAIIREDGRVEITPSRPTLTFVNSKDIILPDAGMLNHMNGKIASKFEGIDLTAVPAFDPGLRSDLQHGFAMINRTIQNKKEIHFHKPSIMSQVDKYKQGNREYFKMNGL